MAQAYITAQAERYKQYVNGNAYIPPQDMGRYEQVFHIIYG